MTFGPFRVLLPSLRRHRRDLTIALCAAIGAQATGISLPLIARWMINRAAASQTPEVGGITGPTARLLWTVACILIGLALLRGALRWQQGMRGERVAQRVLADVRGRMYQHLQRLSQGYFDRRPIGKILIRFIGDANALRTWLARTVITVPADVLTIVGVGIVIGMIRLELLLAAALPLMLLLPGLAWINPRARRWTREGRKNQSRLCALLGERVASLGVIKACNAQGPDETQVQNMIDRVAVANVHRGRLDAWTQSFSIIAATTALGAIVVSGTWLYLDGNVNQGDLLAAVWMTLLLRGPTNRLTLANVIHQRARVPVERIAALLERSTEPGWSPALPAYSGPGRTVELERVGYKGATGTWVIRDLNATVRGPALVTVTDEAAKAKSTLLELLLRLRRPHEGRIYLDGQDVRKIQVADIRRRMGWVDRDQRLVNILGMLSQSEPMTVQSELYEGAWRLTERIAPSAQLDCFTDVLKSPEQHLALNGSSPRDVSLRVAVCCALVHDPPILLLDDPTADLDVSSVQRLIEWLQEAAQDRLVIVATNDSRIVPVSAQTIPLPRVLRSREDSGTEEAVIVEADDAV